MFDLTSLVEHPRYRMFSRALFIVVGLLFLFLTGIFLIRSPLATSIWPWSYTTLSTLSYTFLASITIAIGIPVLWLGITGELAAAAGGAIDLLVTFGGVTIFMLQSYGIRENSRVLVGAVVCGMLAVGISLYFLPYFRMPFRDKRLTPKPVRWAFGFFAVALIIAGTLLTLKQPVFPWRLSGEASIVYGWIFLGAAMYFIYAVVRPFWSNAVGQLAGFLAYDLVLIVPFMQRFGTIEPEYQLSLTIYTAVLIFSGALAIYYLFIYPPTRLIQPRAA